MLDKSLEEMSPSVQEVNLCERSRLTFKKEYGLWQGKFCLESRLLEVLLKKQAMWRKANIYKYWIAALNPLEPSV